MSAENIHPHTFVPSAGESEYDGTNKTHEKIKLFY